MLKKSIIFTMASLLLMEGGIRISAESNDTDVTQFSDYSNHWNQNTTIEANGLELPSHQATDKQLNIIKQKVESLEGKQINITMSRIMKDVMGEENYILAVLENNGYIVMSKNNLNISEYCLDDNSNPYSKYMQAKLSYAGPKNYLIENLNRDLLSVEDQSEVEVSDAIIKANESFLSKEYVNVNKRYMPWIGIGESRFPRYATQAWINTAKPPYEGDYCGPFASAIMLAYYQDYINSAMVPNWIRPLGSSSPGSLISKMIEYTPNATATVPTDMYGGVNKFLRQHSGISLSLNSSLSTWNAVVAACKPGRPICVGLLAMSGNKYGNHWVTVYQAYEASDGNGLYKCVDNWGAYNITIEAHWTAGTVGINY